MFTINHKKEVSFGCGGREIEGKDYSSLELAGVSFLMGDGYGSEPKLALHKQPAEVLKSVVILAEILRSKNLINDSEFLTILGVEYNHEDYKVTQNG